MSAKIQVFLLTKCNLCRKCPVLNSRRIFFENHGSLVITVHEKRKFFVFLKNFMDHKSKVIPEWPIFLTWFGP